MLSTSWAQAEITNADLGDTRLNKRLVTLLDQLAAQPTASLPQACGTWKDTKAAYRFLASDKVTPQAIRDAHHDATLRRLLHARQEHEGAEPLLALTDTTELNLTSQPQRAGTGPLSRKQQGLLVHSVLLCSPTGVALGLLSQQVWARDPDTTGQSAQWRQRALADKESRKWLTALEKTEWALPEHVGVVVVGDREADMYPLFAAPRRAKTDFLVRAAYDRCVSGDAHKISQALASAPFVATRTRTLRGRDGQPTRTATLSVRFTTVTLLPSAYYKGAYAPVTVQVVEAVETNPPEKTPPLHWILLTSLPVFDADSACRCLDRYACRWQIEQYHHILKSGCRLEALQLETAERLQVALALYCLVAWRLLALTYEARQRPDTPCDRWLQPHEWQALYCTVHRTPTPPPTPPGLREAVRWVAQLGGFLGRKGDGEPGVQTLWRGLQRLNDIAATWKLLHSPQTCG